MNDLLDDNADYQTGKSPAFLTVLVAQTIILISALINIFAGGYDIKFFEDYIFVLITPYLISLVIAFLTLLRDKGKIRNLLLLIFVLISLYLILANGLIYTFRNMSGKIGG